MTLLIWVGIYLAGCIISYLIFKYSPYECHRKTWQFQKPQDYRRRDRLENIKMSIFSWVVLIVWLAVCINEYIPKLKKGWWKRYLDKPAKW